MAVPSDAKTLAEKILDNGTTLRLYGYALGPEAAEELHRPVGSLDLVLELSRDDTPLGDTDPAASWGSGQATFLALYEGITSESDFLLIRQVLAKRGELASKNVYRDPLGITTAPDGS